jgi:hypothetical protein
LTINTVHVISVPKSIEVGNDTVVTVTGTKSPVESCTVATKCEELKPGSNPIAQFLKVLVSLGSFGSANADDVDNFCTPRPPMPLVPCNPSTFQKICFLK